MSLSNILFLSCRLIFNQVAIYESKFPKANHSLSGRLILTCIRQLLLAKSANVQKNLYDAGRMVAYITLLKNTPLLLILYIWNGGDVVILRTNWQCSQSRD